MYVHACVHACVYLLIFSLEISRKLLTGLLPNFIVVFLRKRLKSSHHFRKIRPVERYRRSSASSFFFVPFREELQDFLYVRIVQVAPIHQYNVDSN